MGIVVEGIIRCVLQVIGGLLLVIHNLENAMHSKAHLFILLLILNLAASM